ncbi:MAG: prepilin-type N-terminal cleavage/methylation domain-containing protein [Neisseriaceae bacterium]|nr:MAG: prepilin-type N-terminal cleavage/methylation domain-containing protein [Neisseriaceae bacterium]
MRKKNKQSGYTIPEILIGVAVVGVVAAITYAGYRMYQSQQNSNNFGNIVNQITNNVIQSYQKSQTGYTNIASDMKPLIQEKVFPDTMTIDSSAGTVKIFSGAVTLAADANTGGFTLSFAKVPSDTCMKSLAAMGGSGFNAIDVGGSNLWTTGSDWPAKSTIATQCGNGSGNVVMAFHAG